MNGEREIFVNFQMKLIITQGRREIQSRAPLSKVSFKFFKASFRHRKKPWLQNYVNNTTWQTGSFTKSRDSDIFKRLPLSKYLSPLLTQIERYVENFGSFTANQPSRATRSRKRQPHGNYKLKCSAAHGPEEVSFHTQLLPSISSQTDVKQAVRSVALF